MTWRSRNNCLFPFSDCSAVVFAEKKPQQRDISSDCLS
jgi:hypothetical protein